MKRYILLLTVLISLLPRHAAAKDFYGYTDDRPLTIVCDWDFRPYEFVDNNGQPAGYNIDVLKLILEQLEIPHRFVMLEWQEASRVFEAHDADLIHALPFNYRARPYIATQKYVNYYKLFAARKVSTPKLRHIMQLDGETTVMLKRNDYAALVIAAMDSVPFKVRYSTPKDGLTSVRTGKSSYYIWGEEPLKRKVKELALDSLAIEPVDLPVGELRIIGYEKDLIDLIDDTYTRLEQAGELKKIENRWFHPELVRDEASPLMFVMLAALGVVLVVLALMGALIFLRVRAAVRHNTDLTHMMEQALSMGDYYVLEYDLKTGRVSNAHGDLLPPEGISSEELVSRIADDGRDDFRSGMQQLALGLQEEQDFRKRWNKGTAEAPDWREFDGRAIVERENGEPRYIFHTFKDVTREVQEEAHNQEMAALYMKVFETNLVAMSFYGADGKLIDFNRKMYELCEMNEGTEHYFREGNLFDDDFTRGFVEQGSRDVFHVCGRMCYPELGIDKYIESHVKPIFDENGRHAFFIVSTRDITGERDMYMKQREHDHRVKETNDNITRYEEHLRYLLQESHMFVWRFNLEERQIVFSQTLRQSEYVESLDEYYEGMAPEHRAEGLRILQESVMQGKPFQTIHEFTHTPVSNEHAWHSIGGMPIRDAEGRVTSYFGIVRDITDLMLAQQQLRKETARAEDSGRLKSAFLANMTHEIRTPLNAIVGFSDLLQVIDEPDERLEFIRIIRSNCDMLLRLINDILEASSMGQALAILPEEVNLPSVFDDICQTLAQRVQEVEFQKDNPFTDYTAVLDKGRLQQMLTNFTTNAVKYTHEGHIRVGWRPEERNGTDGLYFYCEDTGAGIPKDKQAAVFERFVKLNDFVQGTGLGLSICKAIIDRSGGQIGVTSEGEGHGSTFWFWQPRHLHIEQS